MGLFDSINLNKRISCPKCGKLLAADFQTKDLDNCLDRFVEGFRTNSYANFKFYAYDYCEICKKMVGQYFQFTKNGVLKRVGKPFIEGEK